MMPTLETPRLTLRTVTVADAPYLHTAFNDWEMVKHMTAQVAWPRADDTTQKYLETVLIPGMASGEMIGLAIVERSTGTPIGLFHIFPHDPDDSWGFWIGKEWWGQGYAGEAIAAVVDYAFTQLAMVNIVHCCAAGNEASVVLAKKAGGVLAGQQDFDFVSGRGVAQSWLITPAAWQQSDLKKKYG